MRNTYVSNHSRELYSEIVPIEGSGENLTEDVRLSIEYHKDDYHSATKFFASLFISSSRAEARSALLDEDGECYSFQGPDIEFNCTLEQETLINLKNFLNSVFP